MSTISQKYENILTKMYKNLMDQKDGKISLKVVTDLYKEIGQPEVKKANNLMKITMDNQMGKAISKRIQQSEAKYSDDFRRLDTNIAFLFHLAAYLHSIKFINTRQKNKIEEAINRIKSQKDYKLNQRMSALEKSDSRDDFRQEFFSIVLGKDNNMDIEDDQKVRHEYELFYQNSLKKLNRKLFIKLDSILSSFENRNQMFSKQLLQKVDSYFGKEMGKSDFQININNTLIQIAQSQSLQSNQQHLQMLNQQFEQVKKILNKFSTMKLFSDLKIQLYVSKFGSIISGFATKNTDMDITILTNCYINQIEFLSYLDLFIKAQFKEKKYQPPNFIRNARIPVLKLFMKTKNDSQLHVDIIVNNVLGVVNSKFLSTYAKVPWIKHLGILTKVWAKNKKLIDEQLFSSYMFNLMLIHFLFETNRINLIMDARQRHPDKTPHFTYKRKMKDQEHKFKVYFQYKTRVQDVTSLKRVNIYQVLTEFFHYYGPDGKHWKYTKSESIITVDGSKQKQFDDNFLFVIRDPFDEKHNPGRVNVSHKEAVMKQFKKVEEILKSKKIQDIKSLF